MLFKQTLLFAGLLGVFLPIAQTLAQVPPVGVPPNSFGPLCSMTGLCGMSQTAGAGTIRALISDVVIPAIQVMFVGVGVFYVGFYALSLIMSGGEDSTISEQKKALEGGVRGAALAGVAVLIVNTFSPSSAGGAIIEQDPFIRAVEIIVKYITIVTGAFLILMISVAGFRIIVLQGNEGEIDKQKKNFFNGLLGVTLLLVARVAIQAILPGGEVEDLVTEGAGIVRFLLEIVGALAFVAFMAAGAFFILSIKDDNLKQRGRRMLISTLIILVIVIFSHTLVSTFIPSSTP